MIEFSSGYCFNNRIFSKDLGILNLGRKCCLQAVNILDGVEEEKKKNAWKN